MGDARPIGVFDSGVGGLTVAAAIIKELPGEELIYFGDTARVPYGNKSGETVTKYSRQITRFLLSMGVKAVVVACNTASSNSYSALTAEFSVPMFEMVRYGAEACAGATKSGRVGVIGTEATIRSGAYERAIGVAGGGEIKVFSKACPLFVPLAEEGWTDNAVAEQTAGIYLGGFSEIGIDTLLLGCTHYPLLTRTIQRAVPGVNVINPAAYMARALKAYLTENGLASSVTSNAARRFYVSDETDRFERISGSVLGESFRAEKVDIEGY